MTRPTSSPSAIPSRPSRASPEAPARRRRRTPAATRPPGGDGPPVPRDHVRGRRRLAACSARTPGWRPRSGSPACSRRLRPPPGSGPRTRSPSAAASWPGRSTCGCSPWSAASWRLPWRCSGWRRRATQRARRAARRDGQRRPRAGPHRRPDRRPRRDRRRPRRHPRDDRLAGDAPQRRRREPRAARARGRRRARDPRHGLDRPAARRPRGRARGLRLRVPRLRGGGRDPVRGDPVPPLGGAPRRRRAGGDAADAHGLGPGGVRDRRPHLGRPVRRAARSCR